TIPCATGRTSTCVGRSAWRSGSVGWRDRVPDVIGQHGPAAQRVRVDRAWCVSAGGQLFDHPAGRVVDPVGPAEHEGPLVLVGGETRDRAEGFAETGQ